MTVKEATLTAFQDMPDTFHILQLCRRVRKIMDRPDLMDGTITRKMRELHEDGKVKYAVVEKKHAIYTKNGQLNMFVSTRT